MTSEVHWQNQLLRARGSSNFAYYNDVLYNEAVAHTNDLVSFKKAPAQI